ncbi:rhodanese-like domain-containing protein [Ligilactobacillus salitolerans]|nr:rhodanese-like domain-containing protein [Ligilactobacillus salitolerans]
MGWINIVLVLVLVWLFWGQFYSYILGRRYATQLKNDEFKEGMHKAQVIDVREPEQFKKKHILGARNMPYSQFKIYQNSLRKDMPIYLYDDAKTMAARTAAKLHKKGYSEIYILKAGFDKWDGKLKGTKVK